MLSRLNEFLDSILKNDTTASIYKIQNDGDNKVLQHTSGQDTKDKPWYILDENDELSVVLSQKHLQQLIGIIEDLRLKDYTNHLKNAIISEKGKDIDDILIIALKETHNIIKSNKQNIKSINAYKLVKELKLKYPNLFLIK